VAADALDRRKLMLLTQSSMAVLAAILFETYRGLTAGGRFTCSPRSPRPAPDLPARQSMVPSLVPREHMPNAISLNTSMVQVASVAGPALGGLVIATGGVDWAYACNALSYLVVIAALVMMRVEDRREPGASGPAAGPLRRRSDFSLDAALEGLRFVFRSPLIRSTMPLDFFATFFVRYRAAADFRAGRAPRRRVATAGSIRHPRSGGGGQRDHGSRRRPDRAARGTVLITAIAIYGVATVAFGFSQWFWLTFFASPQPVPRTPSVRCSAT
jgi:MFS family permease